MSEHRLGIQPGFLTKHTLNLSDLNRSKAQLIISEIDKLPCVDGVWMNERKQTIKIAYDASRHNIDEMIVIVEKHGAAIKDSWWRRTKLGWQRQTDENIKDNAAHEASCCNKMPLRFRNKR